MTYPRAREGRLRLAAAAGLCTRMVAGWAISGRMAAGIVVGALERARRRGRAAGSAILHSDRGSQHASGLLARRADEHEARLSVGRTGGCRDGAAAEPPLRHAQGRDARPA
ncbi:DDE-type integrase/transposase/recombinase [Olsenella profusa]|uniref:DDE-type integrase/transposase/recombinase n=1 Tax=Olsenella profusa TaxID=138595 RepID=UPI003522700B